MTNNQLATVNHSTALSPYGAREDVREILDRLMSMHPAAKQIGEPGMRAVAQLSILLGANPLPGANELTVWKTGDRVVTNLGVNFWRRKAHEWGGIVWQTKPRPMRGDELKLYEIADGTHAAICVGVRSDEMIRWRAQGFTVNEIWDMAGVIGIGTSGKGEQAKSGRPSIWTAIKRAEVDALRKAFPVEMGAVERSANVTVDGSVQIQVIDEVDEDDELAGYTMEDANRDLFGVEPDEIEDGEVSEIDEPETEPEPPANVDTETGEIVEPQPARNSKAQPVKVTAVDTDPETAALFDPLQYGNGDQVSAKARDFYQQYVDEKGDAPQDYEALKTWYTNRAKSKASQPPLVPAAEMGAYAD